jgi:hypothetical protein
LLAAVGGVLLASHVLSCSMVLLLGLLFGCLQLWCWCEAAQRVEYIRGHRAGAHGYSGALTITGNVESAAAAGCAALITVRADVFGVQQHSSGRTQQQLRQRIASALPATSKPSITHVTTGTFTRLQRCWR